MYNLSRYRQAQVCFAALAMFYGVAFFAASHAGINAMDGDSYGALAVSAPIKAWSTAQLAGAFVLSMGIVLNGRWRWSCAARLAGALIVVGLVSVLSWSAFQAPKGWPVGVFCLGFAGFGAIVAGWNMVDLAGAIRWRRRDG